MTLTASQQRAQAEQALEKANLIRSARAADKKLIDSGELRASTIILANPDAWQTAEVSCLLKAIHQVGDARIHRICRRACIDTRKPLGDLSERQRHLLVASLHDIVGPET